MKLRKKDGVSTFHAQDGAAWRKWLEQNHSRAASVWLIIYHKGSDTPSVYYDEAVDEALCFGWIDSKPNKRDDESYYQFFFEAQSEEQLERSEQSQGRTTARAGEDGPGGFGDGHAGKRKRHLDGPRGR